MSGLASFSMYTQVWTHVHDRGTLWKGNSSDAKASELARWFNNTLVKPGLAQALVLTPYTNPDDWAVFRNGDNAMLTLLAHTASLGDRSREHGYPVIPGVEANIVPVIPGDKTRFDYRLDCPAPVLRKLEYVIASAHSLPSQTEYEYDHFTESRLQAAKHPLVHTLGHFDRNGQHFGLDLSFFEEIAETGTAIELNLNYFRRYGPLKDSVATKEWDVSSSRLISEKAFFAQQGLEKGKESWDIYLDYRYAHMVDLIRRSGAAIAVGLDIHLWGDPSDVDREEGFGPTLQARLTKAGDWLAHRKVSLAQTITADLGVFQEWIYTPKVDRPGLARW